MVLPLGIEPGENESHEKTPRPLAAEVVVSYVRSLIETGTCLPGDRLPSERSLSERIKVSRPTVRAGIRSLAAMGIVESRHGSGTFVTEGSPLLKSNPLDIFASVHRIPEREIFEARRVLEGDVAALAAQRATAEHLEIMSHEVLEMYTLEEPQSFLIHDIQFHRAIGQASGNAILAALVEMVADLFYEQRKTSVHRLRGAEHVAHQHRRIYEAIRNRDPDAARAEMDAHLRWAERAQLEEARAEERSISNGGPSGIDS